MATKQFVRHEEYIKSLIAEANSSIAAKNVLIETLVNVDGFNWSKNLETLIKNDPDIAIKLLLKLGRNTNMENKMPPAMRHYLCDSRFDSAESIRDIPYYSSYCYQEQLDFIAPELTDSYAPSVLVKPEDLYAIDLPAGMTRASTDKSNPALGIPAESDVTSESNYKVKGINTLSSEDFGVELFKLPAFGQTVNLCPITDTSRAMWTNDGANFIISAYNDYHFGINLNLAFTTEGYVTNVEQNVPVVWAAPTKDINRGIGYSSNLAPTMVALYARLYNPVSGIDESRLSKDWTQFIKLDECKVTTRLLQSSNTAHKQINLKGGFRLRSLLDDFTHPDFISSGGAYTNRPKVTRVDFVLAVRTIDIIPNKGPINFYLKRAFKGDEEISNYIDVVSLGVAL